MVKDTEDWGVAFLSKHIEGVFLFVAARPAASSTNKKYMMAELRGSIDKRLRTVRRKAPSANSIELDRLSVGYPGEIPSAKIFQRVSCRLLLQCESCWAKSVKYSG